MSNAFTIIVLFFFIASLLVAGAWVYGRRVKRGMGGEMPVAFAGTRATVELVPQSVELLRSLSAEPILLKQTEEGLRVQIENRRMTSYVEFTEQGSSGALSEAAAAVTRLYGVRWVVLVTPVADDRLSVQRLA